MAEAEYTYNRMKQALKDLNLFYAENEDSLEVMCPFAAGGDIQEVFLAVRPGQKMFRILAVLPESFGQDLQMEAVLACCAVNRNLGIGQFTYHEGYRKIIFTMASPYESCLDMKEWISQQMIWTHIILTKYGKLFQWLGEGHISAEEFVEKIENL